MRQRARAGNSTICYRVKVAVDPRGDSRVDPQTMMMTMMTMMTMMMKFTINNRTDGIKNWRQFVKYTSSKSVIIPFNIWTRRRWFFLSAIHRRSWFITLLAQVHLGQGILFETWNWSIHGFRGFGPRLLLNLRRARTVFLTVFSDNRTLLISRKQDGNQPFVKTEKLLGNRWTSFNLPLSKTSSFFMSTW